MLSRTLLKILEDLPILIKCSISVTTGNLFEYVPLLIVWMLRPTSNLDDVFFIILSYICCYFYYYFTILFFYLCSLCILYDELLYSYFLTSF